MILYFLFFYYIFLVFIFYFLELTDPRSVSVDGGVFSRSIITPIRSQRPSDNDDNDSNSYGFSSSRGEQQLQFLKKQVADNRLRNFSSTFLATGDWKANSSTSTSLDGSRRRSAILYYIFMVIHIYIYLLKYVI
jgi:hypothetical protein